ncbi:hypothetical protein [Methanothermococcus sp.]|uniref:hypothetical protein n=1 Tax=Methanothermococcus sp. TaxID=2614238 RepID=UPI0025F9667B|nr:hypothetical protein [Methanothermococcus sp.]
MQNLHKDDILISDVKGRGREVGEKFIREYREEYTFNKLKKQKIPKRTLGIIKKKINIIQ